MLRNLILVVLVASAILLIVPQETVADIPFLVDIKEFLDAQASVVLNKWLKPALESIIGDIFDRAEESVKNSL